MSTLSIFPILLLFVRIHDHFKFYLNSKNLSTFYNIKGIPCSSALNLVVIYFMNSIKIKKIDIVVTKIEYLSLLEKKKNLFFILP